MIRDHHNISDARYLEGKMTSETQQEVSYMKHKQNSMKLLPTWRQNSHYESGTSLPPDFTENIDRVHIDDITPSEFYERYEKGSKPVILLGITDEWKAKYEWTFKRLIERFSDSVFKMGESDKGTTLNLTLG